MSRRRAERGQSSVEFALVLPLLGVAVLVAVQTGLVVTTKLAVTHTAREVARVLAVDPDADVDRIADAVDPAARERTIAVRWVSAPLADRRLVEVRVEQEVPSLGGSWIPEVRVGATIRMLGER